MLLIPAQPGRLLPTLRSRCRVLKLAPLQPGHLREAAAQAFAASEHEPPDEEHWPRLLDLSAGSPRRLLSLSTSGGLKIDQTVRRIMTALPAVDWGAAHALADELSGPSAEQRSETFWDLLLGAVAERARASTSAAGQEDQQMAWADLWETLAREREDAEALNLDRKTLLLDALSRLTTASRV